MKDGKRIEVEWKQDGRRLAAWVKQVPGGAFRYSAILHCGCRYSSIRINYFEVGALASECFCDFLSPEIATLYRDTIQAEIDRYNAEHAEPEKIGEPKFDKATGKWYQVVGIEAAVNSCKACLFDCDSDGRNIRCVAGRPKQITYCVEVAPPEFDESDFTVLPKPVVDDAKNWACSVCGATCVVSDPSWRWACGWQHKHGGEWYVAVRKEKLPEIPAEVEVGGITYELQKIRKHHSEPWWVFNYDDEHRCVPIDEVGRYIRFAGLYCQWTDEDGTKHSEVICGDTVYLAKNRRDWALRCSAFFPEQLRPVAVALVKKD